MSFDGLLLPVVALCFLATTIFSSAMSLPSFPTPTSSQNNAHPPLVPLYDDCLDNFTSKSAAALDTSSQRATPSSASATDGVRKNKEEEDSSTTIVYRVCMSPGCMADGAQQTLEKLIALAPPHVTILPGTCHSLCGNGPVVDMTTTEQQIPPPPSLKSQRIRRVSGAKVLQILPDESVLPELVQGYDLVLQGDAAFAKQQYQDAIPFYEQAVQLSFRAALDRQTQREQLHKSKVSSSASSSLEWLVRARRNTAICLLQLNDLEAALLEAQAACNLSRNTCWKCFRVVADIYQRKHDKGGEYESLKTMLALQEVEESHVDNDSSIIHQASSKRQSKLDLAAQNDRRERQFRMQRLEKELHK